MIRSVAEKKIRDQTSKSLEEYASIGLRTLCLAKKIIDPVEYENWSKEYLVYY